MPRLADTRAPAQKSRRHPWFAAFFAFGALMCAFTLALLIFPGSAFDWLWRFNPDARLAFQSLGIWSFALMLAVGTACFLAALGLSRGTIWGTRLAVTILSANLIGDLANALFRRDYRALIGLPVGGAMIFFLIRSQGFRTPTKSR
jgi:hypothetical protein